MTSKSLIHRLIFHSLEESEEWSTQWSSWSSCSEGQEYKHRNRINPKKGKMEREREICVSSKVGPAKNNEYKWSSWSSCSEGQEYKHRNRINPKKEKMEGQSEICVSSKVGPAVHRGKNGKHKWSLVEGWRLVLVFICQSEEEIYKINGLKTSYWKTHSEINNTAIGAL